MNPTPDDSAEYSQIETPPASFGSSPSPVSDNSVQSAQELVDLRTSSYESKLAPMSGTAQEKRESYLNEKSGLERFIDDMTAPTPAGQEPKMIKYAKNVTWLAVGVLVLIEIYVSVKVGGMPFDSSKATSALPFLPDMSNPWLNHNKHLDNELTHLVIQSKR